MSIAGFGAQRAKVPLRPSWCEVDLSAITHNVGQIRSLLGPDVSIFACLKNEAIGCGVERVALHCEKTGVEGLAMGNPEIAVACRAKGVSLPILLYPSCLPDVAPLLEAENIMPTISTSSDVELWDRSSRASLPVFLKIDGGGYRAGAFPSDAQEVAFAILRSRKLKLIGVYGHPIAGYGLEVPEYVLSQVRAITKCIADLEKAGVKFRYKIASSSSLLLSNPEADLNCVDPGRLLMGISFDSIPERRAEWRHALCAIKTRLVMVKRVDERKDVPRATFLHERSGSTIGLIPLGWSEGLRGSESGGCEVLVNGVRTRTVGPIHAELTRIDLTNIPRAAVGDEVVILGKSGEEEITLRDLARSWGETNSDIYMGFAKHLPKVYREC